MSAFLHGSAIVAPGIGTPADLWSGRAVSGALPDELFADLDPKFLRTSDRISQVTLLAAREAAEAAPGDREAAGLIFGLDYGVYPTVATCLHRSAKEGYRHQSPLEFALATPNIAPGLACIRLKLKGPSTNLSCGTLSSLAAVGLASQFIGWSRATTLLAGGASSAAPPLPDLASACGAAEPTECAGFVVLSAQPSDIEIAGFRQGRLRDGSLAALVRETCGDAKVDAVLCNSAAEGLPDVPKHDVRDLAGETLDASGVVAVIAAAERVRTGASAMLVAFRDLTGRDGATLLVRRR
ncbi:MAG: beta-ketoacyl synthase N-terminal-like domain-containing protein [Planctomycetota bacterium]|jgi:hypothetical protein